MYYVKNKWAIAKKQEYNGFQYDSKFEAGIAQDLDLRVKAGELTHYDKQKKIELIVNGYIIATYIIDFVAYHTDGTIEYIEAKGLASEVWKIKWKLFEALYSDKPDTLLTIIFQGKTWKPRLRKKK